jgi:hypothetical protein
MLNEIIFNVIMLNVIMLCVVMPQWLYYKLLRIHNFQKMDRLYSILESFYCQSHSLAWTNTLAYCGICKLRM